MFASGAVLSPSLVVFSTAGEACWHQCFARLWVPTGLRELLGSDLWQQAWPPPFALMLVPTFDFLGTTLGAFLATKRIVFATKPGAHFCPQIWYPFLVPNLVPISGATIGTHVWAHPRPPHSVHNNGCQTWYPFLEPN